MYRVLISGDREWRGWGAVRREMKKLKATHGNNLIVIGGGAPGADKMCQTVCEDELSIHFAEVKALWRSRHQGAGPQRNSAMLFLQPHELIAFHQDIERSKGTKDMIKQARKAGVPHRLITR